MTTVHNFGQTKDGQTVHLIKLRNRQGMEVHILTYGATIQKLLVPGPADDLTDVVLGFNDLASYEEEHPYIGCFVGRNANRIGKAQIFIDGVPIQLTANEGPNQLHGGEAGFNRKVWSFELDGEKLILRYRSAAGEEGFPGNLNVETGFELTEENSLKMYYKASTDAKTVVNLTRHEYFNLAQESGSGILDHKVKIAADYYLPKDDAGLPLGDVVSVKNTPFDLRDPVRIGDRISKIDGGFDHNYVLNENGEDEAAAVIFSPEGNLKMELFSTQPGLQFFSAVPIGGFEGKYGEIRKPAPGLCLEPQHFPDTPNNPHFPGTVLDVGEIYEYGLVYKFSSKK